MVTSLLLMNIGEWYVNDVCWLAEIHAVKTLFITAAKGPMWAPGL